MAVKTYQSPLIVAQVGPGGESQDVAIPMAKNAAGKLRIAQAPYVWNGNENANDVIQLVLLKPGARVLASHSKLLAGPDVNVNAAATLNVGDSNNAIRYANAIVLANAASVAAFDAKPGTDCYVPSDITTANPPTAPGTGNDQTIVQAVVGTLTKMTAGTKLLFMIAFVDE